MPLFSHRKKARPMEPRFAVADLGGGEAEITLYGDVIEEAPRDWLTGERADGVYISAEDFNAKVSEVKDAEHITVRLNSCGGDLYTGIAIHNTLRAMPARVTVRIDGIAASAASVIACAGDEVIAMPGSMLMVHAGMLGLFGFYTPSDLETMAASMEAGVSAMTNIYAAKTGQTPEQVREWVDAETWFVGQEIVDAGFADALDSDPADAPESEEPEDETEDGHLMVAGIAHDVSRYRNVPTRAARIAAMAASVPTPTEVEGAKEETPDAPAPESIQTEPHEAALERGETPPMDVTELKAAHPDLVAEVVAEAAKAERDRIAAIDGIAHGIPQAMVEDAKYAHPMSAEQLAYAAMRADAERREQYLAATEEDGKESGADGVEATPADPSDEEDIQKQEEERARGEVAAAAKVYASVMKGGR